MKSRKTLSLFICGSISLILTACAFPVKNNTGAINDFINDMAAKHRFDKPTLTGLFEQVSINEEIIRKISKPAEGIPWYKYRRIFLKKPRIKAGLEFWRNHAETLATVEQQTGVPPAVIVAILGVETQYGQNTGNYRVIDALSTLAFAYPPRSVFFLKELENFLLMCREEKLNPLTPTGSYAGAMGVPQFMPSSFRRYTVDFNNDNKRDIWHNPDDVIASVGRYFAEHGWKKDEPIAYLLQENPDKTIQNKSFLKENLRFLTSNSPVPNISTPLLSTKKAKISAFEQENGEELWATYNNFYVITHYNRSPLYAMAVFQLSLAISNLRAFSYDEKDINSASRAGSVQLRE
ncbi:MAG: lytic murein transglycosylase B [Gammaproteobacteria bacterium]|nr:lytic murein transglycosylase B [Gammaproteobacteria bacterium]